MRVIYLDVLLVLNFGMDYCILRAASALSGKNVSGFRLCAAAGMGAVYATGCILVPLLHAMVLRIAMCAGMAGVVFSIHSIRQLVRKTLLVLLIAFVFGGCVFALEQLSGTNLSQNGVLVVSVSRKVLLAAAALTYGLSGIVFRNQAREKRPYGETIRLACFGTIHEVHLLVDSGNTLRDPMTGRPVIILTRTSAARILPEELQFLPMLLGTGNAAQLIQRIQRAGITGWTLVSFQSIGGGGMMPCFHPDAVTREDGAAYDSMVAISGAGDICSGEYDGLIEP